MLVVVLACMCVLVLLCAGTGTCGGRGSGAPGDDALCGCVDKEASACRVSSRHRQGHHIRWRHVVMLSVVSASDAIERRRCERMLFCVIKKIKSTLGRCDGGGWG